MNAYLMPPLDRGVEFAEEGNEEPKSAEPDLLVKFPREKLTRSTGEIALSETEYQIAGHAGLRRKLHQAKSGRNSSTYPLRVF